MGLDRRLARDIAPFAATILLGFVLVPIGNPVDWTGYAVAAGLSAAILLAALCTPWRTLPRGLRIVPWLLFLGALALLRDAPGGAVAGVGALALVPVFWLALHGTRGQLLIVITCVAAFFLAPSVIMAGPEYPPGSWRVTFVFAAASAIAGIAVQNLVARERGHADALAGRERDLEAIADLSRSLSGTADARERICAAACDLSGARFALLLEGRGGDELVWTAGAGLSPAAAASAAAVVCEPVRRGEESVGMLIVGWRLPPADPRRANGLVRLLAAEAASMLERADLLGRLTEISLTDELTGLPNRRAWDARLEQAVREAEPVCVAILDLDRFKAFNDGHGHQAGDQLLKEAAAAWTAELRPTDTLARYGGEEFGVLLHGIDLDAARRVVDRLRALTPRGQSCSAGVARREAGETATALLGRADEALYAAKRAGRNRTLTAARGRPVAGPSRPL